MHLKQSKDLTFLQTQNEQINNTHTQPMYSNSTPVNQNTNSACQNHNIDPHNQSTVILQQFSMITQELQNFTNKMSSDINKSTQACTVAQENTGKLIENAISQALTRPQDVTPPIPTIDSRMFRTNHASDFFMKQSEPHPGKQIILAYHNTLIMMHIIHRDLMRHLCFLMPM